MTEKHDVIRRLPMGHSMRRSKRVTSIHRRGIRALASLAQSYGWLSPDAPLVTLEELGDVPKPNHSADDAHPLDAAYEKIKEGGEQR